MNGDPLYEYQMLQTRRQFFARDRLRPSWAGSAWPR
jgi:hypothetical protein